MWTEKMFDRTGCDLAEPCCSELLHLQGLSFQGLQLSPDHERHLMKIEVVVRSVGFFAERKPPLLCLLHQILYV